MRNRYEYKTVEIAQDDYGVYFKDRFGNWGRDIHKKADDILCELGNDGWILRTMSTFNERNGRKIITKYAFGRTIDEKG